MSELDHMDALAAEYVLGSLDVEERAQARNLLEADPTFAAKVELWERGFGELHLMVEPVEPDSGIWARIKAKLPEVQQGIRPPEPSMPPSVPPASPSPAASAPPSLDAIEAAISQAATTLSAEASSAATQEAPLALPSEVTTVSEAVPAVASATASASCTSHCRCCTPAHARSGARANDGAGSPAPEALASFCNLDDARGRGDRRAPGSVAICSRSRAAEPAAARADAICRGCAPYRPRPAQAGPPGVAIRRMTAAADRTLSERVPPRCGPRASVAAAAG